jgi:hypothetical protein
MIALLCTSAIKSITYNSALKSAIIGTGLIIALASIAL